MLRFDYAGRSHPGLVRTNNEDSGFAGPDPPAGRGRGRWCGGGRGGVRDRRLRHQRARPGPAATARSRPGSSVLDAGGAAHATSSCGVGTAAEPARTGMGTTLTALLTDGEQVALGHVGDSRAYLLRDGELTQLTHDQTYVQTLVDAGRDHPRRGPPAPAQERRAPGRRRPSVPPTPDVALVDVRLGDRLLVCSDGLTDLVEDEQVACLPASADPEEADAAPGGRGAGGRRRRQRDLRGLRRRGRPAAGARRPAARRVLRPLAGRRPGRRARLAG